MQWWVNVPLLNATGTLKRGPYFGTSQRFKTHLCSNHLSLGYSLQCPPMIAWQVIQWHVMHIQLACDGTGSCATFEQDNYTFSSGWCGRKWRGSQKQAVGKLRRKVKCFVTQRDWVISSTSLCPRAILLPVEDEPGTTVWQYYRQGMWLPDLNRL